MTSERLRLFVALELPEDARSALFEWAQRAVPDGVRLVPQSNLHLTLVFLGARSREEADAVTGLLPALSTTAGELRTTGGLWLPARRPTVLAVALASTPQLAALQASVVDALVEAVGYEPDQRWRFRPHVTIARVRRGERVKARAPEAPALAFAAEALTLYRSHARAAGSRYEALARERLA